MEAAQAQISNNIRQIMEKSRNFFSMILSRLPLSIDTGCFAHFLHMKIRDACFAKHIDHICSNASQ